MEILFIPLMVFLARQSGSGYFTNPIMKRLPEVLFGLVFAYAGYAVWGNYVIAVLCGISSFYAMEAGHGTFYAMTGWMKSGDDDNPRMQTLDYPLHFIYKILKLDVTKSHYSWVGMSLKGLWIGLPLGVWALLLSPLWALSYYVGHRLEKEHVVPEYLSGMFAGILITMVI